MDKFDILAFFIVGVYFIIGFIVCFLMSKYLSFNERLKEIRRKTMHLFGVFSSILFIFLFTTPLISVLSSLIYGVLGFSTCLFLEKIPLFNNFLNERNKGEMKFTILFVLLMISITNFIGIYLLNCYLLPLISILVWGVGDLFASLIGKSFPIIKLINNKSLGGSIANLISSIIVSIIILIIFSSIPVFDIIIISIIFALVSSLVELISFKGLDTIFVPIALLFTSYIVIIKILEYV